MMTGRVIPATATGTTRTIPAAETTETEIPAITAMEKNYELIEYLNDVNREHAEVLVEQNINGKTDTSCISTERR